MKKLYPEESVQAIADSIRAKTGKTDLMTISEMSGEIDGIKKGGGLSADDIEARFIAQGWTREDDYDPSLTRAMLVELAKQKKYVRNLDRYTGAFGSNRFEYISNLILDHVPDGITSVGAYAFRATPNIAITSLPEGLTSIGEHAFDSCTNLTLTSLPEGLTSIGNYAFQYCGNLALTSLPEGLTSIGVYAFLRCINLALTSLPGGLTSIGAYAFGFCSNLALTSLPEGLTSIGDYTFDSCTNLTLTSLPEGLTSIGNYAFQYCTMLRTLRTGKKLKTIGNGAFTYCLRLFAFIITREDAVVTLSNTYGFLSTPMWSKTGYIYVPRALVDSYKSATNWATYASQIRALEDYTVDGTIDGELDESKI